MNGPLGNGRYELEQRLGHGGMATVFCAHDLKLDRQVAIKLMADNYAGDEDVRKRFSREARMAARLDHPNVVQVFDVGEEEGRPYIVMEYVDGGTVADRIDGRRRSLPRGEAVALLSQLCDGLGHAHAKKLVHRDIKPQNLLLRRSDDCLKITDFGIARAAEETTRLTRPGKVIGTDRYMAPEQLADGKITAATDVYACGVVAGELLPQSRSPELQEIVERCLREDPRERFGDAHELGEALATIDGAAAGGVMQRIRSQTRPATTRGRPTAPLPRTRATARLTRRRPWRARIAALVAAIAIVVAGVLVALNASDSNSPAKDKNTAKPAVPAVSVPHSSDPAQQARELADFLRAQSRPAAPAP
jgi:eukaryotic-like serine/threonine-protein kinase